MSRFNASYDGIGEMLRSAEMQAEMRRRADRGAAFAEAIAPVDPASDHPGLYKESFHVESGVREGEHPRAYGRIVNDSFIAVWVEYGRSAYTTTRTAPDGSTYTVNIGAMQGHRVLGRAIDAMGG